MLSCLFANKCLVVNKLINSIHIDCRFMKQIFRRVVNIILLTQITKYYESRTYSGTSVVTK
jgi:hypothetical protein